ncbi:1,4-alpha-glucan branching enzyme [Arthrobacter pigmenti]|uniref:1,4-alpha-glucan branching enzyme GlgB n=1 Tax=Arthrobacter pigmenti TaxID=271432 RepID=A0A846RHU0_9MICC|nr:1,4-alpha-glucan branching protein GlgB [Arthrobacter pigmenti]NJC21270.1 1,4-alpha-glucan branching enzyme [Arthrobacter pigmenti]
MGTSTPSLPDLLSAWMPRQRWFPAKGRDISLNRVGGIKLEDPAGEVGLEVHLVAVESGRRLDVVNVPLTYRSEPLVGAEAALIGETEHSELGRRWVYDGTHDPVFVTAWIDLVRMEAATADGRTQGTACGAFGTSQVSTGPAEIAVLTGEQSNTSVVIPSADTPMIVKFFRVLAAGESPDVLVSAKLTDAGSTDVPQTFGWVMGSWQDGRAEGEWVSGHLSVLREFIGDSKDAWRSAVSAVESGRSFAKEASELGRVVARVHTQLASAFGSRQATAVETEEFRESLASRIEWAWREAGSSVGPLDAEVNSVLAEVTALEGLPELQRIHADLHLGQILATNDAGWLVLDFEGEPLRPAAERSVPDVPVRDVVGLVRSLEYAAGVGVHDAAVSGGDAEAWAKESVAAFLDGYSSEAGTTVDRSGALYRALWLDKALYEVVYELRNRPDWVDVPVAAVRRMLKGAASTSVQSPVAQSEPADAASSTEPAKATAPLGGPISVDPDILQRVSEGSYHQPHAVLGAHLDQHGHVTIRTLRRLAESVSVVTGAGRVQLQHEHNGIWVGTLEAERAGHVPDYRLEVMYDGEPHVVDDAYRFLPTLGEIDMHLIAEGRHETLWTALGAHVRHYASTLGDITGVSFAVWAPNAQSVRVKADFNGWDGSVHAMRSLGSSGIWELFVPGAGAGACYKFEILGRDGQWREKADPMARGTEVPPLTGSRVVESRYSFNDDEWMDARPTKDPHNGPMSVYEVHLGSWRLGLDYKQLAEQLVEYVSWQGFTHVELMPVAEHPFGGSWGYQVTSYYAPTSRFGHPDDFKYLVDKLHQAGIGVIMDWVPAHFPKDEWALARFDGDTLYEHGNPQLGEHPDWGTLIFDFGRREVRNFLVANALYWLEEFHIDGLRVDAVASMLYLDYSREDGQWQPNKFGGRENLEAISFLQEVNATAYKRAPGIVMIAEESTAFDGVTRATSQGGLGFGIKWNMGWMHDSLQYISEDPINRVHHHGKATFSMVYAYTENFMLPISHDEVVHGKGSLLRKMPGDRWQQLANVRAYLAFQWAHPGKQLIFMGTEFAQESEWSEQHGLDWWVSDTIPHKGVQHLVRTLNSVYTATPALYVRDNDPSGFQWIDENDGAHNTLSFIRWDTQGNPLICIANFSGAPHEGYRVGMPWAGQWKELLNTDAEEYGGSGVGNLGVVDAIEGAHNGLPASANLRVPPLGVLYLVPAQP